MDKKEGNVSSIGLWFRDIGEVVLILVVFLLILRITLGPPIPPMVVVTSTSMLHQDNLWETWFEKQNFKKEDYSKFPMIDGFDRGDLIITKYSEPELGDVIIYERDRISSTRAKDPIIHRVVGIVQVKNWTVSNITGTTDCLDNEKLEFTVKYIQNCKKNMEECAYKTLPDDSGNFKFYITKGDNNNQNSNMGNTDQCSNIALPVLDTQFVTKAWIKIPMLGYPKLWFNDLINFIISK